MLEIYKTTLFDPIENLKGIGPKTLQLFEKLCGRLSAASSVEKVREGCPSQLVQGDWQTFEANI